jgi:hypothetical protein
VKRLQWLATLMVVAWILPLLCLPALIPTLGPTPARADNPIVQTIYTADPAPLDRSRVSTEPGQFPADHRRVRHPHR